MKARTYPDIPNVDLGEGIIKLFHGLLYIKASQDRKELIEEVKRTSKSDLECENRLARLRTLGKI